MTRSELMTVMTSGMAHISGSIMAAYIAFGIEARHLLTAVIMTAPGTILMAKLMEPETETPETYGNVRLDDPQDRREPGGRGRPGNRRRPAPDAERDGDAGLVHRAGGPAERRLRRGARVAALVPSRPADGARLDLPAGGVPHGRVLARQRRHRRPARHPHGAERVHRLRPARPHARDARSPLLHHRLVRPGGIRQLQLGRHPARAASGRWRRSGSTTSPGSASAP